PSRAAKLPQVRRIRSWVSPSGGRPATIDPQGQNACKRWGTATLTIVALRALPRGLRSGTTGYAPAKSRGVCVCVPGKFSGARLVPNVVVVGAQWGDEGKGKIVDWLCEQADVVVRFQGGHNAGHTLVVDGVTYKLSLLPSGVVRPGKLAVIG